MDFEASMTQAAQENVSLDFNCPLVGRSVQIERVYSVLVSRSGKHRGRTLQSTDCSDKDHCPVAVRQDEQVAYDWSRCAFVNPPAA